MGKFITDEHTGLTNWSEINFWLPVMKNRSWNKWQHASVSSIRGVYLGFDTLRGRKFPQGNFRTSVFCEVKTQIVGKTKFFDSLNTRQDFS